MTKVDSPTPKTESWPTCPGSNLKRHLFPVVEGHPEGLMLGVSSIMSMIVARSGKYGL